MLLVVVCCCLAEPTRSANIASECRNNKLKPLRLPCWCTGPALDRILTAGQRLEELSIELLKQVPSRKGDSTTATVARGAGRIVKTTSLPGGTGTKRHCLLPRAVICAEFSRWFKSPFLDD